MDTTKRQTTFIFIILFSIGLLSRYFFSLEYLSCLDSVLYARGSLHYSIADLTPPPPGYFLYIMSGKFLNIFFSHPETSLKLISVFYSGLIAALLFLLGQSLFKTSCGIFSSLLFLTSPAFWYKGITVYGYPNAAFFLLLTGYFCYQVFLGHKKHIYSASIAYAICIGVRPQECISLFFLYGFSLLYVQKWQKLKALFLFSVVCLLWFVPLVIMSGGFFNYLSILHKGGGYLVENSIWGGAILEQINNHITRMSLYFQRIYFLGFLPLFYSFGRLFYLPYFYHNKALQFLGLFILPALFFNIFFQFAEIGHGLAWGVGLFLIIGESIVVLTNDMGEGIIQLVPLLEGHVRFMKRALSILAIAVICSFNLVMFFHDFKFDPYDYRMVSYDDRHFNYADAKNIERHFEDKINYIKKNLKLQKILFLSSRFNSQLMYYFPETRVIRSEQLSKKDSKAQLMYCFQKKCKELSNFLSFEIPSSVSSVVIFDDPFIPYVGNDKKESKLISLDSSNQLLILDARRYRKVIFGYQSLTFQ